MATVATVGVTHWQLRQAERLQHIYGWYSTFYFPVFFVFFLRFFKYDVWGSCHDTSSHTRVGLYDNESRKLLLASFILVPLICLLMWGHHLLLRILDLQGFVSSIHRKHISDIYFNPASKERPSLLFFLYNYINNVVMDFWDDLSFHSTGQKKKEAYIKEVVLPFTHAAETLLFTTLKLIITGQWSFCLYQSIFHSTSLSSGWFS